jgi:hypothetical protein
MRTLAAFTALVAVAAGALAYTIHAPVNAPATAPTPPKLGTTFLFEATTGSAKMTHLEGPEIPGKVPFKSVANLLKVTECVKGNDPSCVGKIETDPLGKAYIYFDGLDTWRLATNSNAMNTTTLTGVVDGVGGFQMSGKHILSQTTFFLTGKVFFAKGTFNPTKIIGKVYACSQLTEHYGTGNFTAKLVVQ